MCVVRINRSAGAGITANDGRNMTQTVEGSNEVVQETDCSQLIFATQFDQEHTVCVATNVFQIGRFFFDVILHNINGPVSQLSSLGETYFHTLPAWTRNCM